MLRAGGKSKTKSHAGAEPPPALDRQLCGAHLRAAGADRGSGMRGGEKGEGSLQREQLTH